MKCGMHRQLGESVALDAVLNVDGFGSVGPRRQEEAIRAGYDLAFSGLALCLAEP